MDSIEFNEKWKDKLTERHYGLSFEYPDIIEWLDDFFTDLEELGVEFEYQQIKFKFEDARFYSTLPPTIEQLVEIKMNRMYERIKETKNKENA